MNVARLAEYLGEEPDGEHIAIRHRFSQNDIAAMAAIARESVNRTMHEWKEKGIVSVPSRSTMVVHKARLQRELGGTPKQDPSPSSSELPSPSDARLPQQ